MLRKFSELEAKMSPEALSRAKKRAEEMLKEMPLHELRQARGISQEAIAKKLNIKQGNISRLEKRTDVYVSTLRKTIEAMGGSLDIIACFPDGDVKVDKFSSISARGNVGTIRVRHNPALAAGSHKPEKVGSRSSKSKAVRTRDSEEAAG